MNAQVNVWVFGFIWKYCIPCMYEIRFQDEREMVINVKKRFVFL